jgi:hypothetical protein
VADRLRSHHAAALANSLEQYYYNHNAPPKGGRPAGLNAVPAHSGHPPAAVPVGLPPPGPVPLVVSPVLAGEGQWVPAGVSGGGPAAMFVAQFRADPTYTSQITSAV